MKTISTFNKLDFLWYWSISILDNSASATLSAYKLACEISETFYAPETKLNKFLKPDVVDYFYTKYLKLSLT